MFIEKSFGGFNLIKEGNQTLAAIDFDGLLFIEKEHIDRKAEISAFVEKEAQKAEN